MSWSPCCSPSASRPTGRNAALPASGAARYAVPRLVALQHCEQLPAGQSRAAVLRLRTNRSPVICVLFLSELRRSVGGVPKAATSCNEEQDRTHHKDGEVASI